MAYPLYVAFIWHQHQPLYKSSLEGPYRLPWVRLHGTKDYLDLVLILEQFPQLHQTVNLVPSLIAQLQDYVAGTAFDPYLQLTLQPIEQLNPDQKQFIISHFFDANYRTLIAPHRRYRQLYAQREDWGEAGCLQRWSDQDYEDLLAWHNLAWIDPLFWGDPQIARWLERTEHFSLRDRQQIWQKQREILSCILPQHCKMQKTGQLEIITSPYAHPILPLLADTQAGQIAIPSLTLPQERFQWPEDMGRQIHKAWALYHDEFGRPPQGLWPPEQAVSPAILEDVARQGFRWICSDEAVLGQTLKHFFHRDGSGCIEQPELLYRPYNLETKFGDLAIVFRDRYLSDLIGFTYSAMKPEQAAMDLVQHLRAIAQGLNPQQTPGAISLEQPHLVTIALDGENCWEFYDQDGKPFLEGLYTLLSQEPGLKLVTVSEFLDQFPPTQSLSAQQLHSGSWVDASFSTWIGDPAKNQAWDLLTQARQVLAQHPAATEATHPTAWDALYAAEGSDWFWWFGEGHSSNQDAIFDQLFREHLQTLYQALGEPIPELLNSPLAVYGSQNHQPQSLIHPRLDGQGREEDWHQAGRIELGGAWGTMHQASAIQRLWYGADRHQFYLRFDLLTGAKPGVDCPPELHLFWFYPDQPGYNSPMPLSSVPSHSPLNYLYRHHLKIHLIHPLIRFQEALEFSRWQPQATQAQAVIADCIEIGVPWQDLQVYRGWSLSLIAVLARNGQFQNYLPEDRLVTIQIP
jgi:alpha-amylase/alpha-mannosidase (GH57 family)